MPIIVAGVFGANVLTLAFWYAFKAFGRETDPLRVPWLAYAGVILPMAFVALSAFIALAG